MKHSSIPTAQSIVQHFRVKGIKNLIISPGSRNAPLTIGFTEDSYFNCFSIVDERCAAFFALGMARQLQEPVAVLCTSGSALLNYYPAVAEAFYSDIPLVIVSADRPIYKIDIGDGQTIRQDRVFERHIGYSANLRQDVVHATDTIKKYVPHWLSNSSVEVLQKRVLTFNDGQLNNALNMALLQRMPVHINVPLEEPLYNRANESMVDPNFVLEPTVQESISETSKFIDIWNASKRKIVLVGVNDPHTVDQRLLDFLGQDPSVIVLTETTSNLHHPNFFPSIDSLIAPLEKLGHREKLFDQLRPDLLLTFGGLVISKKIKVFLRHYGPKHHWHIDPNKAFDTFFCLSHHFKTDINTFFTGFLTDCEKVQSDYFSYWNSFKKEFESKRKAYLNQVPFSDIAVFSVLSETIPSGYQLHLANSSAVRYAQLFDFDASIKVFCNRGTSGIDGSTSTAIGASIHCEVPTVLITGDLSFFYDSNGLWNNYIRPDFRIILINNAGGGIFRILPGQEDTKNFETYFETVHELDASQLCKMHGFEYHRVGGISDLEDSIGQFYKASQQPKLLEIQTPRILNNKILLAYFDFISSIFINH